MCVLRLWLGSESAPLSSVADVLVVTKSVMVCAFLCGVSIGQGSLFSCGHPVIPEPPLEITLSPLFQLNTLVENQLTVHVGVSFWTLLLSSHRPYANITQILHCNCTISLKIKYCKFSNLVSLFQIIWTLQDIMQFYINFRVSLSISTKRLTGILIGIVLKLSST